jgi:Ca2+-binding EF-hand superfamily protein
MQPPQELKKVLLRFRKALSTRGLTTNTGVKKAFTHMDGWDENKTLDRQELYDGLRILGVQASKDEVHMLFNYMDKNKDNKLSLNEFFLGVRGELTPKRLAIITEVFTNLDKDHNGVLDMNDLRGYYSACNHPDL